MRRLILVLLLGATLGLATIVGTQNAHASDEPPCLYGNSAASPSVYFLSTTFTSCSFQQPHPFADQFSTVNFWQQFRWDYMRYVTGGLYEDRVCYTCGYLKTHQNYRVQQVAYPAPYTGLNCMRAYSVHMVWEYQNNGERFYKPKYSVAVCK